ncbi:MAG: hypothetical protein I3J02_04955 [Prevotella sp.]|nr:hypothetical protein [Prevotella sp.]
MKPSTLFSILLLLAVAWTMPARGVGRQYYPVRDRLEVTSLDGTWQFRLDGDNDWREIQVPGNWETQGVKTPEYGRDLSALNAVYKRTFRYQPYWKGRDVILRLDGAQNGFTVLINGQKAGEGHSAHTMHQFNITPLLRDGTNEIQINLSTHSAYWLFDVCDAWSVTGIQHSVQLFSVPRKASIADAIFTSKVHADNSADVRLKVLVNQAEGLPKPNTTGKPSQTSVERATVSIQASLLDERFHHVADMRGTVQGDSAVLQAHLTAPRLWTAETPTLYLLEVSLLDADNQRLQKITEKVGIREVRVEGTRILLNNREIFLRGVCLSENDAIEGSAMSLLNRRRQLEQIKAANVNFIRTAHYPLNPEVTRLCDEMGIYVCEEIPFASRGDEYLKRWDPKAPTAEGADVVSELKARAKATIDRDRNCPSIILWSHGNENKIYPVQDSVLRYTMYYDPSRLRVVPQTKGPFSSYVRRPSPFVNVLSDHYGNDGVLRDACARATLPIINTEYAHSFNTAFAELEQKYALFRAEPKIYGGSVWCFQDQSILTNNYNQQNQLLKSVRIDSLRYIDNYTMDQVADGKWERQKGGTDGVVYGDGYPQEDYFELAQVYTPVFLEPTEVRGGEVKVRVENRFDFIGLQGYSIRWQIRRQRQMLEQGTVWLSAPARGEETAVIDFRPEQDAVLCMQVMRPDGSLCYERNCWTDTQTDYAKALREAKSDHADYAKALVKELLDKGLQLRVGRLKTGVTERDSKYWMPYLLPARDLRVRRQGDGYRLQCRWYRHDKTSATRNYIDGDLTLRTDKSGAVEMSYVLTPSDTLDGKLLDFGPTIILPQTYDDVAWMGEGPFSHTPGKTAFDNPGVWQLNKEDLWFYGNRASVRMMTVVSYVPQPRSKRQPVAPQTVSVVAQSGNLLIENIGGRIAITDNLLVGGYGSKFAAPVYQTASDLGQRQGCLVLRANATQLVYRVFGDISPANAEHPYLDSYGK